MSHSAEANTIKKMAARAAQQAVHNTKQYTPPAQQYVQQGQQYAQQFTQRAAQRAQQAMGNSGYTGEQGVPGTFQQCGEVCFTRQSVFVWILVIALSAITLWYLGSVLMRWIATFFNRPAYNRPPVEAHRGYEEEPSRGQRGSGYGHNEQARMRNPQQGGYYAESY